MKDKQTTKPETKPPVDREAIRVLAIELGAREAARRVGVNESTVLSWARRDKWKLPKRTGGATKASASAITLHSKPGDVLIAGLKENEEATRTSMSIAARRAAEGTARLSEQNPALARNAQELQQLAGAMARIFGWASGSQPSVNYYGDVNTLVVCDEAKRKQLIEQRQRLLEQEAKVIELNGHKAKAAVPAALPEPDASAGTENGIVARDKPPVVQKDSVFQHMQSIGRAESWKSEENHAGSFGPWPEEYE